VKFVSAGPNKLLSMSLPLCLLSSHNEYTTSWRKDRLCLHHSAVTRACGPALQNQAATLVGLQHGTT
jgi:hypothetical protein